jgi:hypothetical protein
MMYSTLRVAFVLYLPCHAFTVILLSSYPFFLVDFHPGDYYIQLHTTAGSVEITIFKYPGLRPCDVDVVRTGPSE